MRFIADEGVDAPIVHRLRLEGHDVLYVQEYESGATDKAILEQANSENRILITRYKDFGELAFLLKKVHSGIILNRLYRLESEKKAAIVVEVIDKYQEELIGAYTVIQPRRIRIRKIE